MVPVGRLDCLSLLGLRVEESVMFLTVWNLAWGAVLIWTIVALLVLLR